MKKYFRPRYIALYLLLILVIIQFIQPEPNEGSPLGEADFTHTVPVPDSVMLILDRACFDCHSNHTKYPWYARIQPVAWWLDDHISEGKEELNFSVFNQYKDKRQVKKFKEIEEQIREHEMPLSSYLWIHSEARLTAAEEDLLCRWAARSRSLLENK